MNLILPKHLLDWVDKNRGERSRASYIVQCLFKIKEMSELGKN